MPRSQTSHQQAKASASKEPHVTRHTKQRQDFKEEQSGIPGVQKIKASIRQTRRLLAKDKLAADVRVETERRLKALEGELAQAEISRKERAMSLKYHKVKFFEKKKALRRIKQTKAQLEAAEKKSEKKKLAAELLQRRIDLNYVLHYPRTEKYISLYPPEVRNGKEVEADPTNYKTSQERDSIRQAISTRMEEGQLSSEPELEAAVKRVSLKTTISKPPFRSQAAADKPTNGVEDDAFFGDEADDSN